MSTEAFFKMARIELVSSAAHANILQNRGTGGNSGTILPITSCLTNRKEAAMPVILWLLGVPLVVVVALMLTHVI
jgi:hypothetical protein